MDNVLWNDWENGTLNVMDVVTLYALWVFTVTLWLILARAWSKLLRQKNGNNIVRLLLIIVSEHPIESLGRRRDEVTAGEVAKVEDWQQKNNAKVSNYNLEACFFHLAKQFICDETLHSLHIGIKSQCDYFSIHPGHFRQNLQTKYDLIVSFYEMNRNGLFKTSENMDLEKGLFFVSSKIYYDIIRIECRIVFCYRPTSS